MTLKLKPPVPKEQLIIQNRELVKMILPLVAEQFLIIFVGLVDTAMVSYLSEAAVSGVSLVDMINQLIIQVLAALATGGAVIASQYIGHKEQTRACEAANQLLLLIILIALGIMALFLVFRRPFLKLLFGQIEDDVMAEALIYLKISAVSYPFIALYSGGTALFRSMKKTNMTLILSLLMNVVNIVCNYLFMFVLGLGVAGAALGSLAGRGLAGIAAVILLLNPAREVHLVNPYRLAGNQEYADEAVYAPGSQAGTDRPEPAILEEEGIPEQNAKRNSGSSGQESRFVAEGKEAYGSGRAHFRLLDLQMAKRILYIGIPNGLENGMFQLGKILVVSVISAFGTVQIAANAVANNLDAFGVIPGFAFGLAMITIVGQCVGAGDYAQAEYFARKLNRMAGLVMFLYNVCLLILLPQLLNLYVLSDETRQLASTLVTIHFIFSMFLWVPAFTKPNALRAANDVKFTMTISIVSMWAFRVFFGIVLGKWMGMGVLGIWIAMLMDWAFRALMFALRFQSKKWQRVKLI